MYCPRGSRQHCTGKNPVQCRLNNIWSLFRDLYFKLVNFLDDNQLLQVLRQHCSNLADITQEKSQADIEQKDKIVGNRLTKGNCLRLSNTGRGSVQGQRCQLKNKKLELWLGSWSLRVSCNIDLEPLGLCNSDPLKQSRGTCLQMFFKKGSLEYFAKFTGKQLCWRLFLIKLQTFGSATFLKRDSNSGVSCRYWEIFRNSFFYRTAPVDASVSPTTVK